MRPISTSVDYQSNKAERVDLSELGNGKILIYNGAKFLHKIDNTASLNLWMDDMPMGQFNAGEFAIVDLNNIAYLDGSSYEFTLHHLDVIKFKSRHTLGLDSTTKIIMIKPTIVSNKIEVKNQFPDDFYKFRYIN